MFNVLHLEKCLLHHQVEYENSVRIAMKDSNVSPNLLYRDVEQSMGHF